MLKKNISLDFASISHKLTRRAKKHQSIPKPVYSILIIKIQFFSQVFENFCQLVFSNDNLIKNKDKSKQIKMNIFWSKVSINVKYHLEDFMPIHFLSLFLDILT